MPHTPSISNPISGPSSTPVVDLHTHILPQHWPSWTQRSGYAGWIELAHERPGCARMCQTTSVDASSPPKFFREVHANCWDPSVRLAHMDASRVDIQVLSTVPVMFAYWAKPQDAYDLARLLNDHLAQVCAAAPLCRESSRRRFIPLATIPMQDPDLACAELDRCVRDLKMPGVQIGTNVNGLNLDEPGARAVLAHAAKLNACVFIHPWDMLRFGIAERPDEPARAIDRMARYWAPWLVGMPTETTLAILAILFGGVLDTSPNLRICFAHGGGSFPGTIGRIRHGYSCRPDLFPESSRDLATYLANYNTHNDANTSATSPSNFNSRDHAAFWVDSLVHDASALTSLINLFSPSRICLGSDYPFPLCEDSPGQIIRALPNLDAHARAAMLGSSALAFLAR